MKIYKIVIAIFLLFGAIAFGNVSAATVDFGGLPQSNGSVFTGPYTEDGFSVTATGGQVFEGHVFGNPQPSLVVGSVFNAGNNGNIGVSFGSGVFTFDSFDLAGNNGVADYTVTGLLGGTAVFTLIGSVAANYGPYTFTTVSSSYSGLIDSLGFALTSNGSSLNIDNIVVTAATAPPVPEPETYAMLLAGLGLLSFTARRRKQSA